MIALPSFRRLGLGVGGCLGDLIQIDLDVVSPAAEGVDQPVSCNCWRQVSRYVGREQHFLHDLLQIEIARRYPALGKPPTQEPHICTLIARGCGVHEPSLPS